MEKEAEEVWQCVQEEAQQQEEERRRPRPLIAKFTSTVKIKS